MFSSLVHMIRDGDIYDAQIISYYTLRQVIKVLNIAPVKFMQNT